MPTGWNAKNRGKLIECIDRETRCFTRDVSIFPGSASCWCLVAGLLAECDEGWISRKIHPNLKD